MTTFSVTVLGSSSAIPTLTRNLSAHLLNVNERLFLIDCAEGTQMQIRRYHIHFQRIRSIFISHLHGDHYFGLIGLLTSFHLLGRKDELHLYGPPMLEEIIDIQLKASQTKLLYPLKIHPVFDDSYRQIYEDDFLTVNAFPLLHSVPTVGFIFREKKRERKLRKEILGRIPVPIKEMTKIKKGEDFIDATGKIYKNDLLTTDPPKQRSYAYCSDTSYNEFIIPFIQHCDLLYHEATFMQDMIAAARDKLHATAQEAATIAKKANVKKLLLGHFSARYDDLDPLLQEAKTIFPETYLAEDGKVFNI